MADNNKVPTGTRYDALRMIAMAGWDSQGEHLSKYLAKGVDDELQMGAISGLSDVESPNVAPALLRGLGHFSATNRKLAIDALLRTDERTAALLDALEQQRVQPSVLNADQVKALRSSKNATLRERAAKVLPR